MTRKWLPILLLAIVLCVGTPSLAACEGEEESDGALPLASETASGEPLRIGVNLGYTGSMASEAAMTDHGIRTALEQVGYQVQGRPIEIYAADNESDPVAAVEQTRQLVEGSEVDVILGPILSSSAAAVSIYLGETSRTPCVSILGLPRENLAVAQDLVVIPVGLHSARGYYLGRYASRVLGHNTANIISYDDTVSRELTAGFLRAFVTEGGGQILSTQYAPGDTFDFSPFLATLEPADVTVSWVAGNQARPFLSQYNNSGLTAPLVMDTIDSLREPLPGSLGDASLNIVAAAYYVPPIDSALNSEFVAQYAALWDEEQPNTASFGGWLAANVFLQAVTMANGDTAPETLIQAMSLLSLDTPAGFYTIAPYDGAFVGTGNLYVCRPVESGQRIDWQPVYTYEQVLFDSKE